MASIFTIQASNHAIKSVTVFKSLKAEVVRTFTLNLKPGQYKFRIKGLPSSIDTQSVRVSVIGNGILVDVGCTIETNSAQTYASDDPSEAIRALFTEKAELEREEVIRRQESQLLLKYAQTLSGEQGNPTQIAAFLKSYADRAFKPFQAVAQIKEKIRQIDRQIEALQEKAASKRGTTLGQVYVGVFADTECFVELKLTYFVSNVQWKPNYGLHVTTNNGQASASGSLHYWGTVTQATGEDWNNVLLLLSTASDDAVKCIPRLRPIKLTSPKFATNATTIPEPATVFLESPVIVAFLVQGKSTIPSDGVDHQVSVAVLPLEAKISYICIPRMEPKVFLQCKVKNTSVHQLLAGFVTVTLDDHFVSKTSINNTNPGDSFECTLGDDTSTRVTYSRSEKTVQSDGGAFSEVSNTTRYTAKISIHNKHKFDITDLIVREVIPTSDDEHVKIVLRKPVGLLHAKQGAVVDLNDDGLTVGWGSIVGFGKGGRKEGRFEWKGKVRSGAQVNLEAEWEVTVPGETPWVELQTLSSVPPETDWKIARTRLQSIKTGPLRYVKAHKEVKAMWNRLRRQIVLRIGQLTNDPVHISGISLQLVEIVRPSTAPPHDSNLYIALCYSLAKAIVLQAEIEVSAAKHSAGPLAQVAFSLLETLDGFAPILFAKLVQRSGGWLIPIVVPDHDENGTPWSSSDQFIKVSGWRKSTIGQGRETPEEYANRVSAIMRVYFSILKINPGKKALDPMFQLPRFWTWFAGMVGDTKLLQEAITPQLIYTALDVLGVEAENIWGEEWIEMLALVHEGVTAGYENSKLIGGKWPQGARTRVLLALEKIGLDRRSTSLDEEVNDSSNLCTMFQKLSV